MTEKKTLEVTCLPVEVKNKSYSSFATVSYLYYYRNQKPTLLKVKWRVRKNPGPGGIVELLIQPEEASLPLDFLFHEIVNILII